MVVYTPFILFYGQDANGDCYVNLLSSPDKKQNGTISGLSCYNRSPSGDYRHPLVVEENLGGLKASSHPHPVYKAKPPTPCWSIIKMQRVFWPLTVEACGGEEPCQVGNFFFFKGGDVYKPFDFCHAQLFAVPLSWAMLNQRPFCFLPSLNVLPNHATKKWQGIHKLR